MKKKFDAVKFQREIREKLSEKYTTDREGFLNELKAKYGSLKKRKLPRSSDNTARMANI